MLNVLFVDSWLLNNKVIEQDSQKFFENKNIEYTFFESSTPEQTKEILTQERIDIIFIDIASEKFDGLKLVRDIKAMNIRQPKMVAVTVLYDKKYRYEALKLKVYRYIYKPYDFYEIQESLEKLFGQSNYSLPLNDYVKVLEQEKQETSPNTLESQEDDFLDFDEMDETDTSNSDDSFIDFDEMDETDTSNSDDSFIDFDEFNDFDEEENKESVINITHDKTLMDAYNQTHKQVSSSEFLDAYADVGIDVDELIELEEDLDALIASILFEDINDKIPDIVYIFEKYNRFLYTFTEFEELCKVIYALVEILKETDFDSLKRKDMAKKFIVAILEDLVDWKEHVFVLEDAVDVYYINASILNSFVLLKDILKK